MTTLRLPGRAGPLATRRSVGLATMGGAELVSSALGFFATMQVARRLGPGAFGRVDFAAATAAWLLVLVRGGVETIVVREVARRPRLVGPLTDALIGVKLICAAAGHLALLLAAMATGRPLLAVAGFVLWPSALSADIGARAGVRLRFLAALAVGRSAVLLACSTLVRTPADAMLAALLATAAESAAALVCWRDHRHHYGRVHPRFRRRSAIVLARRGLSASVIRFGRVGIYSADLIALGLLGGADLGPFAAARWVVFAAVSIGLIVPSALAPSLARAWASGPIEARAEVASGLGWLAVLAVPSTLALLLLPATSMTWTFGPTFGGPWLALIGSRLPFLLLSSYAQAALIACRREDLARCQSLWACGLGVVAVPMAARFSGAIGASLACLGVEAVGAAIGSLSLRRLSLIGPEDRR